jgi:hypothetical protein
MTDYLIERIYAAGAKHVFFIPGTGCMFIADALARKEELTAISTHHEQAAGMAALTYAKCNETLGACVVTTGCGGTNALTALLHAWQDSVPCLFISGQAARHQTVHNSSVPLRQMGAQENNISPLQNTPLGLKPRTACDTSLKNACTWRKMAGLGQLFWMYIWIFKGRILILKPPKALRPL